MTLFTFAHDIIERSRDDDTARQLLRCHSRILEEMVKAGIAGHLTGFYLTADLTQRSLLPTHWIALYSCGQGCLHEVINLAADCLTICAPDGSRYVLWGIDIDIHLLPEETSPSPMPKTRPLPTPENRSLPAPEKNRPPSRQERRACLVVEACRRTKKIPLTAEEAYAIARDDPVISKKAIDEKVGLNISTATMYTDWKRIQELL